MGSDARGSARGLLPFGAALLFQGGFAVAVMALDRANRALPANLAYVVAVEAAAAAAFLAFLGLRTAVRRRRIGEAARAPLDAELPRAGAGEAEAWRDLCLAMRETARAALAERNERTRVELEDLLASVHALKTPATALSLMAERAEREGRPLQAPDVRLEIDELARIVDRCLGRMRLEDFAWGSRMSAVGAAEAVRACVRRHRRLLIARGIAVAVEGDFTAETDPAWLGFILDQLVSNAAKYAATRIGILLSTEGRNGILEIRDDGPGMDGEDLARAFGRSASGRAGRERGMDEGAPASSGYGLHLAARAASRLGLRLELASEAGTVARLGLPLALPPYADLSGM